MPFPVGYERKFGFEGFQDTHPSTPLPGTQVDVELDGIAKSTAALVAFLQKFTRADGKLANGSVGVDQLAADFSVGFKAPTTWEPGIMYVLGDTVFEGTGFWNCTTPHTSGSIFEPANWALIIDFGSQAQASAASAAASAASAVAAQTAAAEAVTGTVTPTNVVSATTTAPPASPAIGDTYAVPASATGVWSGKAAKIATWTGSAWGFVTPAGGAIVSAADTSARYVVTTAGWSVVLRLALSRFMAAANPVATLFTTAASLGANVDIDVPGTMTSSIAIGAAVRAVSFSAILTFGNFDFTGSGQAIVAGDAQIFSLSGTGRLKGFFYFGPHFLVSWLGVIGTDGNQANAFTASAPYAATNKILLQALEDYRAQCGHHVEALFTRYMTAFNGGITNALAGAAVTYCGTNRNWSRIYCPDGVNPRVLTGNNSSSQFQDLYRDLGIYGKLDSSTGVLVDVSNWVGAAIKRCQFSLGAISIQFKNVSSGYCELCVVEDCIWASDAGQPLKFTGAGSSRSFALRGTNSWSPGGGNASGSFCAITSGVIPYLWHEFNVTVTPGDSTARFIIDNASGNVCDIRHFGLDLERGAGAVTIVNSGQVVTASGPPSCYNSGVTFQHGNFIWNGSVIAISTSRYVAGGVYDLRTNFDIFTGSVSNSAMSLKATGNGSYRVKGILVDTVSAAQFVAQFDVEVATSLGLGGTAPAQVLRADVKILANAASIAFTSSVFTVNSSDVLCITANFGARSVKLSGTVLMESNGLT